MSQPKKIIIRRAHLWEAPAIGRIAARTYNDTALISFLCPHRNDYYSDYERGFIARSWKRMLDVRGLGFVAVAGQGELVGYVQLRRMGEDAGARRVTALREREGWVLGGWWLTLLRIVVGCWFWVVQKVVGDRSVDAARQRAFEASNGAIDATHWEVEGRRNRWHVQSCVVLEEWQGKGVGKGLMAEVVALAELEGVVAGLEASPEGEGLYRRLGFKLLGRFPKTELDFGEDISKEGGVMMYTPVVKRET